MSQSPNCTHPLKTPLESFLIHSKDTQLPLVWRLADFYSCICVVFTFLPWALHSLAFTLVNKFFATFFYSFAKKDNLLLSSSSSLNTC